MSPSEGFWEIWTISSLDMFNFKPASLVKELNSADWAMMESILGAIDLTSSAWMADPEKTPCREAPTFRRLILWSKEFIITRKREGDRTDPCLTPRQMGKEADRLLLSFTLLVGDWYQALIWDAMIYHLSQSRAGVAAGWGIPRNQRPFQCRKSRGMCACACTYHPKWRAPVATPPLTIFQPFRIFRFVAQQAHSEARLLCPKSEILFQPFSDLELR